MMGTHHALCGAAAWVALTSSTPALPSLALLPLPPEQVAVGAILCAGAALLPDADHPSATIAHSVPVAGRVATGVVSNLAGGHRRGTHSLVAAGGVLFLALGMLGADWGGAVPSDPRTLACAAAGAGLLAFALKVLGLARGWARAWLAGAGGALAITLAVPEQWAYLGAIVAVGWIAHLAGDLLTTGGLPLLWPLTPRAPRGFSRIPVLGRMWLRSGNIAVPILGNTGSRREWALLIPIGAYATAGVTLSASALLGAGGAGGG